MVWKAMDKDTKRVKIWQDIRTYTKQKNGSKLEGMLLLGLMVCVRSVKPKERLRKAKRYTIRSGLTTITSMIGI
jgi:hypothetical protein